MRDAQRHADYAYRLAVDPPAAKELRLFGLADWVVERFRSRRQQLADLLWQATRLRERPVLWSLLLVLAANIVVFWSLGSAAADGRLALGRLVTFATAAVSTSMIAFGGLSWALDGAAAPAAAVLRLQASDGPRGRPGTGPSIGGRDAGARVRFRNVTFRLSGTSEPVLAGFDLTIPAGSSLAIVGANGAGKTTIAKLLCRLYDPQEGAIEVDGVDLRTLDLDGWRSRVTAVFQDFIRFELPLRDNVAPGGRRGRGDRSRRSPRPVRWAWPSSTRCWRAATRAARTYPAASGSASPWRGRSAPCGREPAWCCSTSRRPSSTCAARPRSSIASSPPRGTPPRS